MALFTLKDAWSSPCHSEDEFDPHGFCIGSFTNEDNDSVLVATGSLQGMLRIYQPKQRAYQVDDLELETQLDAPILQIACGRFVSHGQGNVSLAVLHPRALTVYDVVRKEAGFIALEHRYQHQLGDGGEHFTAANMVFGPFGGVRGKDFIAVQSLDGQIHVFEQESFAFIRQLNHVLLPGPLAYVRKMDSLLVANSQFQVDCYKYHMLASSTTRMRGGGTQESQHAKKDASLIQTDWTFTVGEQILDIWDARVSKGLPPSQVDIVILCDRSIYCLSERGVVRSHIRLEVGFRPLCSVSLPILEKQVNHETNEQEIIESVLSLRNILVAAENGQVQFFKQFQLVWQASVMRQVPVAVAIGQVGGVNGMILSMSDDGQVSSSYVGTEPSTILSKPKKLPKKLQQRRKKRGSKDESKENAVELANREQREADDMEYEELDREHRKLLERIRNLHRELENQDGRSSSSSKSEEKILVRVQIPSTLDVLSEMDANLAQSDDPERKYAYNPDGQIVQLTIKVFVTYKGVGKAQNVMVSLHLPDGFMSSDNTFTIPQLLGGSLGGRAATPISLNVPIRVMAATPPPSLNASVVCTYKTTRGATKTCTAQFRLPFFLAARVRPAIKNSASKITIDANQTDASRLVVLFDDMIRQPGLGNDVVDAVSGASANVLSVEYFDGSNVTVLASKSGGRYRIQGTSLGHLWLMSDELEHRLREKFQGDIEFSYTEPLPLTGGLFSLIDQHHSTRMALANATSQLNDRAHQYRLVQKRLLSRFKDKNAPPLKGLDLLLSATHTQVMEIVLRTGELKQQLKADGNNLSAAIQLILRLCFLKYASSLNAEDEKIISAHFLSNVIECDGTEMGWEELLDASITHVLRTTMAKVPKIKLSGADVSANSKRLTLQSDTSKLKKHINIFFDRIGKGARPSATLEGHHNTRDEGPGSEGKESKS